MRTSIENMVFEVRGLKRKEIKALRRDGFTLETLAQLEDHEKRDEGWDRVFELATTGCDPDELTQHGALQLWAAVVEATYAGDKVKKKSESLHPSLLGSGNSTAPNAGPRASSRKGTARKSGRENG